MRRTTLTLTVLLVACGEAGPDAPGRTLVSDSAGIRVVTNVGAAPELSWTIQSEPAVRVGGAAAPEDEQLYQVVSAAVTDDGFVIANAGTSELHFYDARGNRTGTVGRQGEGPGEYQTIRQIESTGADSIMVNDLRAGAISVLDAEGSFVRRMTLQAPEAISGVGSAVGFFPDGSVLAQGFSLTEGETFDGLRSFPSRTYLFSSDGEFLTDFGLFHNGESYFVPIGNGGFTVFRPYFAWSNSRVPMENRLALVDSRTGRTEFWALDGSMSMIVRRVTEPREPTAAEVERFRNEQVEKQPEGRRTQAERVYEEMPVPRAMPVYGRAVGDASGHLWLEVFRAFDDEPSVREVLGPDGTLLGRITLPEPMRLLAIGDDVIVGVTTDDLDVEEVRVYRLDRSPGM